MNNNEDEHNRRFEDSFIGRIAVSWQMIAGIVFLVFSLGINMATLWDHTQHLSQIDQWHKEGQGDRQKLSEAVVQLKDLSEAMDKRIISIEDWRNGVNDIYVHSRRRP